MYRGRALLRGAQPCNTNHASLQSLQHHTPGSVGAARRRHDKAPWPPTAAYANAMRLHCIPGRGTCTHARAHNTPGRNCVRPHNTRARCRRGTQTTHNAPRGLAARESTTHQPREAGASALHIAIVRRHMPRTPAACAQPTLAQLSPSPRSRAPRARQQRVRGADDARPMTCGAHPHDFPMPRPQSPCVSTNGYTCDYGIALFGAAT